jgi:hypothetical protein
MDDCEMYNVPPGYNVAASVYAIDAELKLSQDQPLKDGQEPGHPVKTATTSGDLPKDVIPNPDMQDTPSKPAATLRHESSNPNLGPGGRVNPASRIAGNGPWTPGLVRWVGRELVIGKYWDTLAVHVEEGKEAFRKNMAKHGVTESWLSNTVMKAYTDEFRIAFYNLSRKSTQKDGVKEIQISLTERGQILPTGPEATALSIYTLWNGAHFDMLIPCPKNDPQVEFEWDQEADSLWFRCQRMPKDGACGYHLIAVAMNTAGIEVPAEFREPVDRYLLVSALLLLTILYTTCVGTPKRSGSY